MGKREQRMKWILVTTNPTPHVPTTNHPFHAGWNIGDVFARLGTESIIREVDPDARIELLNMDAPAVDIVTPRDFDRLVLAGRPLFWPECEIHPEWVEILGGWPCENPRKVLAFGVGDCYPLPRNDRHLRDRLHALKSKVWKTVLRFDYETEHAEIGVCPAAFCLLDRPEKPTRKLCNFMDGGGHYPGFASRESEVMRENLPYFAEELLDLGFDFVAHTKKERQIARGLDWPEDRIVYAETIEPYLDAYASASHYIGNRMHGAVILAGRQADALAIGFDSRLGMVARAGCDAVLPSEITVEHLQRFAALTPSADSRIRRTRNERRRMVDIMREFAKQN